MPSDLTGPAFAWGLHGPATQWEAGEILYDLAPYHAFADDPVAGGFLFGSITLDRSEARLLNEGLLYLNIFTPTFPGGEIRGQLIRVRGAPQVPDTGPSAVGSLIMILGMELARRFLKGRRAGWNRE